MLNRIKQRLPLLALAGLSALSFGMVAAFVNSTEVITPRDNLGAAETPLGGRAQHRWDDPVLDLALQPAEQRAAALTQYAQGRDSISQHRARYLLALDLIAANRGGSALPLLEGLEADYPEMAPYVLLAQAQAQTAAGQTVAAQATQDRLLTEYSDDPAIAPLLYSLGQQDSARWDELLQRFPDHPKSVDVAHQRLTENPNRADALPLLLTVARAGLHHPSAGDVLLRLKNQFADQLQPEDWQTVGFGLWRRDAYAEAGPAYAQAPPSPRNLYRAARGLQIGRQRDRAIALYSQLDQQFPDAPETATGLLRLTLSLSDQQSLDVLDQVVARFPDRAAEALGMRADILDNLNSAASAQATRDAILQDHSASSTAAQIRLTKARNAAQQGDLAMAVRWGQEAIQQSPDGRDAAEAGFWAGKWATDLGQTDVAQTLWEQVIAHQPESYFAWRSAVHLGWDVGDFTTVRDKMPAIAPLTRRSPLPTGSDTLKELYILGQDRAAWERWQTEYVNRQDPSVPERFVDGLMRQTQGDFLDGIFQVASLASVDDPEDIAAFKALKQKPDYWHGVYPFPFADLIQTWSAQRQLNPLLVLALIRQESRFMPRIRSVAGAAGLMQVMPGTAQWIKDREPTITSYEITDPHDNIKLGTWYLDYTHREYDNNSMLAMASYNAGPGNVANWVNRGGFRNDDDFADKIPFPETRGYIQSVFGNYWNYLRLYDPTIMAEVERIQQRHR
ncbi:tail length tape measure protein [Leptolyngbya sp. BL0902]|uniref:lytic transglycosylase domain-containing protein n=1 Tax=Leptolyngbya sp. BL0902 TaxID=1115757 RepID=UPI0018E7DEE1|nr:lytic transglycosylase domain-containing protein [Leptolyngbya sp. BL0902]QQE65669.1 tail length tape measure protein [Leptolyngbya sp. BL0902]